MPSKPFEKIRQIYVKQTRVRFTLLFLNFETFFRIFSPLPRPPRAARYSSVPEPRWRARHGNGKTQHRNKNKKKTICANKVRMKLKNETRKTQKHNKEGQNAKTTVCSCFSTKICLNKSLRTCKLISNNSIWKKLHVCECNSQIMSMQLMPRMHLHPLDAWGVDLDLCLDAEQERWDDEIIWDDEIWDLKWT